MVVGNNIPAAIIIISHRRDTRRILKTNLLFGFSNPFVHVVSLQLKFLYQIRIGKIKCVDQLYNLKWLNLFLDNFFLLFCQLLNPGRYLSAEYSSCRLVFHTSYLLCNSKFRYIINNFISKLVFSHSFSWQFLISPDAFLLRSSQLFRFLILR